MNEFESSVSENHFLRAVFNRNFDKKCFNFSTINLAKFDLKHFLKRWKSFRISVNKVVGVFWRLVLAKRYFARWYWIESSKINLETYFKSTAFYFLLAFAPLVWDVQKHIFLIAELCWKKLSASCARFVSSRKHFCTLIFDRKKIWKRFVFSIDRRFWWIVDD